MKITILGSGTLYPLKDRGGPGYLVEANGEKILFDTGMGTLHKLDKIRVDILEIKHIFYTHTHNDHTCELAPILWYLAYVMKNKQRLNNIPELKLTLYGPKGFKKYFKNLWTKMLGMDEQPDFIKSLIELKSGKTVKIGDIKIRSEQVEHPVASLAFKVENNKNSFVYSGDTQACDGLRKLAGNADLLMAECAFPKKLEKKSHMNSIQCGRLAREAGVKKLILTHMYPEALAADIKSECAEEFDGEIIVAEDLMQIEV